MPTTSTEHREGIPTWPRWRVLYALWNAAEDWRTRRSLVRVALQRITSRLH